MRAHFVRKTLHADSKSNFVPRMSVSSLRGLAAAAVLFGLLGLASCAGLTHSGPFGPGGVAGPGAGSGADADTGTSISVSPLTVGFGSVVLGTSNSQTMTLTNTGTVNLTVTSVAISGAGFAVSGIPTPLTLGAGQTANFTASFQPSSAGAVSGGISIKSSVSTLAVTLSGRGVTSAPQVSPSTSKVSFGNVAVGTSSSQPVVLTNTGNADLSISSVAASGTGFAASGGSGVMLTPNQSVTITITFDPKAAGGVTGGLAISSNATNTFSIQLSGAGVAAQAQHSVALNWSPSGSPVIGYFVYRGTTSGGPYAKLISSVDAAPSYTDSSVAGGQTYYYVVTSVDPGNVESAYSNQVVVTIPTS
jgi:Abnormal spindle-like microcephaly-assoc'd, ASPM-SPD-2-Hydin